MITARDFIHCSPSPLLLQAAADFAYRGLVLHSSHPVPSDAALQAAVADSLARICFQRYLAANQIPFQVDPDGSIRDPMRYRLEIGGRRCQIRNFFVCSADQRIALGTGSGICEQAAVLLPFDVLSSDIPREHDVLVFSAVMAESVRTLIQTQGRVLQGAPSFVLARLDRFYREKAMAGGGVCLRNEGAGALDCRLTGVTVGRSWREERIRLAPGEGVRSAGWSALAGLRAELPPVARLLLERGEPPSRMRIEPAHWINLWLYGCHIVYFGWLTKNEYRRYADLLPAGSENWFYHRTRGLNWAIPVRRLHSLANMIAIWNREGELK
jgi:hypothetical protein